MCAKVTCWLYFLFLGDSHLLTSSSRGGVCSRMTIVVPPLRKTCPGPTADPSTVQFDTNLQLCHVCFHLCAGKMSCASLNQFNSAEEGVLGGSEPAARQRSGQSGSEWAWLVSARHALSFPTLLDLHLSSLGSICSPAIWTAATLRQWATAWPNWKVWMPKVACGLRRWS